MISGPRAGLAFFAVAQDVSEGGMCLESDGPIPENCLVQIEANSIHDVITAEIRYVRQRQTHWLLGIQFQNFRWDHDPLWPDGQFAIPWPAENEENEIPVCCHL